MQRDLASRVPVVTTAWHRALWPSRPNRRPAPTQAALNEAALRHLSRFAATELGLLRVLQRQVRRWESRARAEGVEPEIGALQAHGAARDVVSHLVSSGVLDDGAFASARARRLVRGGRSQRAISSHLAAKGVQTAYIEEALKSAGDELPSALAYARRRRIGPFRSEDQAGARLSDLGAFARAGFPRDVAERALEMDADTAEALVLAVRRGEHEA